MTDSSEITRLSYQQGYTISEAIMLNSLLNKRGN
ncbi:hypothetical protein METH109765_09320 [Mesobacillus thioparans]